MTIKARFTCNAKVPAPYGDTTTLHVNAVYESEGPNKVFHDATPYGTITMGVQNDKPALAAFEVGKTYDLTFEPVAG